jgi:flagellar protein FlaG
MSLQAPAAGSARRAAESPARPGGKAEAADGMMLPSEGNPASTVDQSQTPTPQDLRAAVQKLNDYAQSMRRELNFSVDDDTGRTIVKVLDAETHEVIRQIPPEEVLTLAQHLATASEERGNLLYAKA